MRKYILHAAFALKHIIKLPLAYAMVAVVISTYLRQDVFLGEVLVLAVGLLAVILLAESRGFLVVGVVFLAAAAVLNLSDSWLNAAVAAAVYGFIVLACGFLALLLETLAPTPRRHLVVKKGLIISKITGKLKVHNT